ncbi:Subtilisin-like protease [Sphaceloma murrayae]|uniref:Subtilisin-like protease n=1 Tax=Sphaceloma murrayae TaxID=2082308 RepID=A0A2K1R120_9PEZI|nr:Subtilisin-like protease [Sphaceloma murrayae]
MKFTTALIALFAAVATAAPIAQDADVPDVTGRYIVRLKPGRSQAKHLEYVRDLHARSIEKRQDARRFRGIEKEFGFGKFQGYSGHFDDDVVKEIEANDDVEIVEADQIWTTFATQANAPYGLAALSSRTAGATSYTYDTTAANTFGYVVDTGILTTHTNFGGRASNGFNAVGGAFSDTNGHGTHVAGTMGSTTYGVAKGSRLIAVKVFSGRSGSTSTILSGFDWAVNDIVSKGRQNVAVINMSLGGGDSAAFRSAIAEAYADGVLAVVAAGNDNVNAANTSPANAPNAITVGSVDSRRQRSTFSNFGAVVDVFASGTGILSTWYTSTSATNTISGTSMASPHVAGLVNYLQALVPGNAASITSQIINRSLKNVVTNAGSGSPNRLASNLAAA